MKIPFASCSNIGCQIRVGIMAEDLDKMTDEQWAELRRLNARICIYNLDDSIRIHPEEYPLPSIKEEIEAILQRAKSDDSTQTGRNNDDLEPILDLV